MEDSIDRSGKRGLDRYTEMVWRPVFEKELAGIKGKVVVDMGCGFARYTAHLVGANEYHGVDLIDSPFADIRSNVESVPLPDSYADVVVAIGILDYSDPDGTLSEIFRILKPRGNLYLMVPNALNPYHVVSNIFGSREDKKRFTVHTIMRFVDDAGFVIDYVDIRGFCFYVPTKYLQELFIPIFLSLEWLLGSTFGNNVYLRAHRPKR